MANTFVNYTGDGSNTDFTIPFPYLRVEDVRVFVNGAEADWSLAGASTARLDTAPSLNDTVLVRRQTDVSDPFAVFSDVLTPHTLNGATTQNRYAAEELSDQFETFDLASDASEFTIPAPAGQGNIAITAADGSGSEWVLTDLDAELSNLTLPDPNTAGNGDILVIQDGAWTAVTTQDYFGNILANGGEGAPQFRLPPSVNGGIPDANGPVFLTTTNDRNTYVLKTGTQFLADVGAKTAAQRDVGTQPQQVPILVNTPTWSGADAALSSDLSGARLQDISKIPEVAVLDRQTVDTNATVLLDGDVVTKVEVNASLSRAEVGDSTKPTWVSKLDNDPQFGAQITQGGTYTIDLEVAWQNSSGVAYVGEFELTVTKNSDDSVVKQAKSPPHFGQWGANSHAELTLDIPPGQTYNVQGKYIGDSGKLIAPDVSGQPTRHVILTIKRWA